MGKVGLFDSIWGNAYNFNVFIIFYKAFGKDMK